MHRLSLLVSVVAALSGAGPLSAALAAPIVFEAAGPDVASITAVRDAFRTQIGGGTAAGANGSFGGLRREINWDGVPDAFADPNVLPGNYFNVNSPRGVVLNTPGTGFMVSANAGQVTPTLFGFANDFQAFSAQRLFTAVNSNVTDVQFFLPGTTTAATTSAFGLVFVDVEVAGQTVLQFFDVDDNLLFSDDAMVGGNQGFSFLGARFTDGTAISRVRIIAGSNTIVANGVLGNFSDDIVVMDDFVFAEPLQGSVSPVPEPGSLALVGLSLFVLTARRRRGSAAAPGGLPRN
jgi:hypothetical protein